MKRIIFILSLFFSFVANGQYTPPTGYTNINSRYDWLAGVFRALGLPAGGNAAFTTGQAHRAGSVYYDSTGADAGLKVWNGSAWTGVGEVTQSKLDDTAAAIRGDFPASYTDADARAALSLTTTGTSGVATYNSGTGVFNIPDYASSAPNLRVERAPGTGIPIWYLRTLDTTLMLKDIIGETFIDVGTKTDSTNYVRLDTADTGLKAYIAANSGASGSITGTLASGQIVYATGTNTAASSSNFLWNNTNQSMIIAGGSTASVGMQISKTAANTATYLRMVPATGTGEFKLDDGAASGFMPMIYMQPDGTTQNNSFIISRTNDSGTPAALIFSLRNFAGSGGLSTKPLIDFQNFTTSVLKLTAANNAEFSGSIKIAGGSPGAGKVLTSDADGDATWTTATIAPKNQVIENPTASENMFYFRTDVAITITSVTAVLVGSGSPSVTYQINFGTDRTSGTNVYTSGQTVTSTTTGTAASGVNDATIPAGSWVWTTTSAATDVTQLNLSITYTKD